MELQRQEETGDGGAPFHEGRGKGGRAYHDRQYQRPSEGDGPAPHAQGPLAAQR